jgi:hypothetical protein
MLEAIPNERYFNMTFRYGNGWAHFCRPVFDDDLEWPCAEM